MKQIITQHGWGLNKHFWDDYKVDFFCLKKITSNPKSIIF